MFLYAHFTKVLLQVLLRWLWYLLYYPAGMTMKMVIGRRPWYVSVTWQQWCRCTLYTRSHQHEVTCDLMWPHGHMRSHEACDLTCCDTWGLHVGRMRDMQSHRACIVCYMYSQWIIFTYQWIIHLLCVGVCVKLWYQRRYNMRTLLYLGSNLWRNRLQFGMWHSNSSTSFVISPHLSQCLICLMRCECLTSSACVVVIVVVTWLSHDPFLSVANPVCEEIGCGEWKAPLIKNPAYKGKWRPPMIKNPKYSVSVTTVTCIVVWVSCQCTCMYLCSVNTDNEYVNVNYILLKIIYIYW